MYYKSHGFLTTWEDSHHGADEPSERMRAAQMRIADLFVARVDGQAIDLRGFWQGITEPEGRNKTYYAD